MPDGTKLGVQFISVPCESHLVSELSGSWFHIQTTKDTKLLSSLLHPLAGGQYLLITCDAIIIHALWQCAGVYAFLA